MTKDLPKNSKISFRKLNIVGTVRAAMMERIDKSNKMRCNLFELADILNIEL